jgi:hypothetical protein
MQQSLTRACALAIATLLFAASPAMAGAGFCTAYAQTWSNAGRCKTCRLTITPKASQRYEVVANNGWKAEISRSEQSEGATKGEGRWSASAGPVYAGKSFKLALARTGSVLKMAMLIQLDKKQRIVVANFRCLDKEFTSSSTPALR